MKNGFIHLVDGRNTYRLGFSGFLLRIRGFVSTNFLALLLAGTPMWWPLLPIQGTQIFSKELNIQFSFGYLISLIFIIITILFSLAYKYVRERSKRSLNIKHFLHKLAHESRNSIDELLIRISKSNVFNKNDSVHERKHLLNYANSSCNVIANYFSELTKDNSVACSIRLLSRENNTEVFETIGRSNRMNPNRNKSTEVIPASEGVAKFFNSNHSQGVLFINDIQKASINGVFKLTGNCKEFSDDYKYLTVTPINGWLGNKQGLIGLLFVTSKNKNILKKVNIDLFRFSADILASTLVSKLSIIEAYSPVEPIKKEIR